MHSGAEKSTSAENNFSAVHEILASVHKTPISGGKYVKLHGQSVSQERQRQTDRQTDSQRDSIR